MKLPFLVSRLALFQRSISQHLESPYFPGYGFECAPLTCTAGDHSAGHSHGPGPTSPECRAGDLPFLTTLAYCMNSTCDSVKEPTWERERFWAMRVTGDPAGVPKWHEAT
ncbi:hypothetical protein P152DRAFT_449835 [Eremomyces bilateralis CBS 781.70]|uniref:Uncharacterized protein n=1 Tax=Eremomyces bilateralis CBS 781.70 TaxID=1392243 RepID=A0A6G1G297_9PEZI|nr:uncharacterized protein P152DRAFT_449835 [Eremomyces bilateralis CBS 781.70]KAF1812050.1 hypothetical protein P152DRAFT_449835 [Eremomyces bilateralis CBS 781.70]